MKKVPHNFSELLKDELTDEEIENLRTSFDTIGDIVILEIPEDLQWKKTNDRGCCTKIYKKKSNLYEKSAN